MIPNCIGCEEEFYEAEEMVSKGYYIATTIGREFSDKGHLCLLMVDDEGKIVLE